MAYDDLRAFVRALDNAGEPKHILPPDPMPRRRHGHPHGGEMGSE